MRASEITTCFLTLVLRVWDVLDFLNFWLHHGTELCRGTASHPDWIALEWARASNASPEILRLLTPSVWTSLQPHAFCAGVELDMYAHVPGRSDRRRIRQLTQQSRDHYLFLHAAGSLCQVRARAWLDRGADTPRGTPCEPLKSAFRWAEEAQGDEILVSTLRASAADLSGTWSGGREGSSEKRPFSCSSVPKVFATQPLNVCGWLEGADCFSFPDFWSFGADDPGRSVAVAWAALSDDLERLKDIESDDRSIFIQRPGVEEANLPDVFEHWTLREYVELAFLRAAKGSSKRHNLHTVLLWMEGQESTEAFDFAFGPMNEHLDVLWTLTLKGKAFHVFSFEKCNHQLRLIKGC